MTLQAAPSLACFEDVLAYLVMLLLTAQKKADIELKRDVPADSDRRCSVGLHKLCENAPVLPITAFQLFVSRTSRRSLQYVRCLTATTPRLWREDWLTECRSPMTAAAPADTRSSNQKRQFGYWAYGAAFFWECFMHFSAAPSPEEPSWQRAVRHS